MSSFALLLLGMALVLGLILWLRQPAFLALVAGALAIATLTPDAALRRYAEWDLQHTTKDSAARSPESLQAAGDALVRKGPMTRLTEGFGDTCGKVGILIAMASVIGMCLLESGAAQRIVAALLRAFGVHGAPKAFVASGFILGIPVYFDTVFFLLVPLAKAMRRQTGRHYLLYILTIVAGGTMAHSLVPPTPGPLFVASALGVSLGSMVLGGMMVGSVAAGCGYLFATWTDRRWEIPLREADTPPAEETDALAKPLPPLGLAVLPILLPLLLLALGTVSKPLGWDFGAAGLLFEPNASLMAGAAAGLVLLARQGKATPSKTGNSPVESALRSGAGIILITAAGGAFGTVLKQTAIGPDIAAVLGSSTAWAALPIVFLVTAIVRTAQGSATVAMLTAAPVAAAFLPQIPFHPVYLALAVGCGSKPVPWMNDSGFWIITRMTGMQESETLRFVTTMMTLMGVVGLIVTIIAAWLFPFV